MCGGRGRVKFILREVCVSGSRTKNDLGKVIMWERVGMMAFD